MHGSCVARTVNQFQDVKSPASPLAPLGGGGGLLSIGPAPLQPASSVCATQDLGLGFAF